MMTSTSMCISRTHFLHCNVHVCFSFDVSLPCSGLMDKPPSLIRPRGPSLRSICISQHQWPCRCHKTPAAAWQAPHLFSYIYSWVGDCLPVHPLKISFKQLVLPSQPYLLWCWFLEPSSCFLFHLSPPLTQEIGCCGQGAQTERPMTERGLQTMMMGQRKSLVGFLSWGQSYDRGGPSQGFFWEQKSRSGQTEFQPALGIEIVRWSIRSSFMEVES